MKNTYRDDALLHSLALNEDVDITITVKNETKKYIDCKLIQIPYKLAKLNDKNIESIVIYISGHILAIYE